LFYHTFSYFFFKKKGPPGPEGDEGIGGRGASSVVIDNFNSTFGTDIPCEVKIISFFPANAELFGTKVTVEDDLVAIIDGFGTSQDVYVYTREGGTWANLVAVTTPIGPNDFNSDILLAEENIYVGARANTASGTDAGAVFVYERTMFGVWTLAQTITPSDASSGDEFGLHLAFDNNTLIVSAPSRNNLSGAVYVFEGTPGTFVETQILTPNNIMQGDIFGSDVDIRFPYIIAGANRTFNNENNETDSGSVYIYQYNTNTFMWEEQQEVITDELETENIFFGSAVSINPVVNQFVACAPGNGIIGRAYFFELRNGTWEQIQVIQSPPEVVGDFYCNDIDMEEYELIVGAPFDDIGRGAVYTYRRDNEDVWRFIQKVIASDGSSLNGGDRFGQSVAISGRTAIAGAPRDSFTPFIRAGAAYTLEPVGGFINNEIPGLIIRSTDSSGNNNTFVQIHASFQLPTCSDSGNITLFFPLIAPRLDEDLTLNGQPTVQLFPDLRSVFTQSEVHFQSVNYNQLQFPSELSFIIEDIPLNTTIYTHVYYIAE